MTLGVGTRLGPYEVVAPLGAGGMGEVYEARDTRLDRTVAIKVLPPAVASDPERRTRFEREAKTIASLNHSHICTLHDVGEHDGSLFLVMEHVAGETLASRLQKGPLPFEQALTVATEVADALAVAHRAGIIHRDLKPGNVMLTKSGAKLLDFGLAKLTGGVPVFGATSLVTAEPVTEKGCVLGTVPYLAPEQLEGKDADARSDLFSFGAMLYEMVTGKRAFEGGTRANVVAAILDRDPPPPSSTQPLAPPALDRLVRRCLAKAPDDRPDSAHDVADDLRWMRETSGAGVSPAVRTPSIRQRLLRSAAVLLVGVFVGAALTSWIWVRRLPPPSSVAVVRTQLPVRPAGELNSGSQAGTAGAARYQWTPTPGGSHTAFAWTPDGRALVFVGRRDGTQQLYVREMDHDEARSLPGTEDAQLPAVSPDGRWVAFWVDRKLKKVPLATGPAVDVATVGGDAPPRGLSWDDRGNLYFGEMLDRHIWKVATDGVPTRVTANAEGEWAQILPEPLPGGRILLYTVRKRDVSWGDEEIVAQNLATGVRKVLLRNGAADARYVPTGHLVFLRRGVLCAVAFDTERLEVGAEVPLFDGVAQALTGSTNVIMTGAGQFAIAPTGALAWLPGPVVPYPRTALVSVDRHGRVSPLPAPPNSYSAGVRLAPGGRQLAVTVRDLNEWSFWSYDLIRHTLARLTEGGGEAYLQLWTPDGQRLVFSWLKDGRSALALQRADGTAPPEVLGVGADDAPSSWTPDGRHLVVVTYTNHLAVITIENGHASEKQLTQSPYREWWPEVSPDGHWLAYCSDESGRFEVYVRAYPSLGPRTQVSVEGGVSPAWDGKGQELFFLSLPDATDKRHMMVARFEPGSPARLGAIQSLFECPDSTFFSFMVRLGYDVAPDGQRFYTVQTPPPPPAPVVTHINLIQNWFEELKAKVRVEK